MRSSCKKTPQNSVWRVYLALGLAVSGWGFAWVGIRAAVVHYDAGPLALGRYLVGSLVLVPLWFVRGRHWPARGEWPAILLMGLFGFTIYNLLINEGERTITAGTAAFVAAIIPVLNTIGARIFFKEKVVVWGWVGLLISTGGVAIITVGGEGGGFQLSTGALLVVLAAFSATVYGLLTKRFVRRYHALDVTTWAIWCGTLFLLPFFPGLLGNLSDAPPGPTLHMIFLGIFPGAISYASLAYAIQHLSMARAISCLNLIPPFSVGLAWVMLDELPPAMTFVGGLIAMGGVILVQTSGRRR